MTGVELQVPPLHIHIIGSLGLHPNHILPSRVPLDSQLFRRPNYKNLELAIKNLHLCAHWP